MKIEDRYYCDLREDRLGLFGAVLTMGASLLLDDDSMGWICTYHDSITGLEVTEADKNKNVAHDKAYMSIKIAVMNLELEKAQEKKIAELEKKRIEQENLRLIETEQKENKKLNADTNEESNDFFIKIVIYGGLIILAIWLLFNIAIPFVIINAALILLIYSFINKEKSEYIQIASIISGIYLCVDYKLGWLTQTITKNAIIFKDWIPYIFYLNLTAAIITVFLFVYKKYNFKNDSVDLKNDDLSSNEEDAFIESQQYYIKNITTQNDINIIDNIYNNNLFNKTNCNNCNYLCFTSDNFCENCGNKLLIYNCPSCNYEFQDADNFCENCGTKLN